MKINPSFTGSTFVPITQEYRDAQLSKSKAKKAPQVEALIKKALRKAGINFHKLGEYEIKKDYFAFVTSDPKVEAKALECVKAQNLTPMHNPEIRKIGGFVKEMLASTAKSL